ncbi:MAG TPA: hypothetical protein VFK97_01400 [Candidatus Saccharimonadales bacterium]|nr:hypothetical protein [Candidatus Saccharimonadales bacterium]
MIPHQTSLQVLRREHAQRVADRFFLWFVATVFLAFAMFVLGKWDLHNHHLVRPWFAYGFALVWLGLALAAFIGWLVNLYKARP